MSWRFWERGLDGAPFECLRCRSVRFVIAATVVGAGTRGGKPAISPSGTVLSCIDCGEGYEHTGQGLKPMKGRAARSVISSQGPEFSENDVPADDRPDTDMAEPTRVRQQRMAMERR